MGGRRAGAFSGFAEAALKSAEAEAPPRAPPAPSPAGPRRPAPEARALAAEEAKALLEALRLAAARPEFQRALGEIRAGGLGAVKKRQAVAQLLGGEWRAPLASRGFGIDEHGFPQMLAAVRASSSLPGVRTASEELERTLHFPPGSLFGARAGELKGHAAAGAPPAELPLAAAAAPPAAEAPPAQAAEGCEEPAEAMRARAEEGRQERARVEVRHPTEGAGVSVDVPADATLRQVKEELARLLGRPSLARAARVVRQAPTGHYVPVLDSEPLGGRTELLLMGAPLAPAARAAPAAPGAEEPPPAGDAGAPRPAAAAAQAAAAPQAPGLVEVAVRHAVDGAEVRVAVPRDATFGDLRAATARLLGDPAMLDEGRLVRPTAEAPAPYAALRDSDPIGDARVVLALGAELGAAGPEPRPPGPQAPAAAPTEAAAAAARRLAERREAARRRLVEERRLLEEAERGAAERAAREAEAERLRLEREEAVLQARLRQERQDREEALRAAQARARAEAEEKARRRQEEEAARARAEEHAERRRQEAAARRRREATQRMAHEGEERELLERTGLSWRTGGHTLLDGAPPPGRAAGEAASPAEPAAAAAAPSPRPEPQPPTGAAPCWPAAGEACAAEPAAAAAVGGPPERPPPGGARPPRERAASRASSPEPPATGAPAVAAAAHGDGRPPASSACAPSGGTSPPERRAGEAACPGRAGAPGGPPGRSAATSEAEELPAEELPAAAQARQPADGAPPPRGHESSGVSPERPPTAAAREPPAAARGEPPSAGAALNPRGCLAAACAAEGFRESLGKLRAQHACDVAAQAAAGALLASRCREAASRLGLGGATAGADPRDEDEGDRAALQHVEELLGMPRGALRGLGLGSPRPSAPRKCWPGAASGAVAVAEAVRGLPEGGQLWERAVQLRARAASGDQAAATSLHASAGALAARAYVKALGNAGAGGGQAALDQLLQAVRAGSADPSAASLTQEAEELLQAPLSFLWAPVFEEQ